MSETPQIAVETPLQQYNRFMAQGDERSPVERLRFYLSLALTSQDWQDVEPFIDDITAALSAAEQRAEAMGKEDTVESLGDWQYLSADDGWITCPDRAAAEREQKTLNTVIRYVRYYHLAAIASGAGDGGNG